MLNVYICRGASRWNRETQIAPRRHPLNLVCILRKLLNWWMMLDCLLHLKVCDGLFSWERWYQISFVSFVRLVGSGQRFILIIAGTCNSISETCGSGIYSARLKEAPCVAQRNCFLEAEVAYMIRISLNSIVGYYRWDCAIWCLHGC